MSEQKRQFTPRDLAMQDAAADISSMMPSGMLHGTGAYEKWVLGAIQRAFERHEVFSEKVESWPFKAVGYIERDEIQWEPDMRPVNALLYVSKNAAPQADTPASPDEAQCTAGTTPSGTMPEGRRLPADSRSAVAARDGQFDKQETPRSDAEEDRCRECGLSFAPPQLARQLERELAAAHERINEVIGREIHETKRANDAVEALSARGHITELPAEFAALAEFYQVDDMPALIRIQAEHIERLQKKLPPLRGPESDPQNYRQG